MRARRPSLLLLTVPLLAFGSLAVAGPVLAAPCDGSSDQLMNGGFETPVVSPNTFTLFPAASVPPWQTTDGLGEIEIWGDGYLGVPAGQGNGFAELNANTAGTLYQDVVSTPGATMSWTLLHRGRGGDDTMLDRLGLHVAGPHRRHDRLGGPRRRLRRSGGSDVHPVRVPRGQHGLR